MVDIQYILYIYIQYIQKRTQNREYRTEEEEKKTINNG